MFVTVRLLARDSYATDVQRGVEWLYASPIALKKGDIVVVPFGYIGPRLDTYAEVVKAGRSPAKAGSEYDGAVKVVKRLATPGEVKALLAVDRTLVAYERARERLTKIQDGLREAE